MASQDASFRAERSPQPCKARAARRGGRVLLVDKVTLARPAKSHVVARPASNPATHTGGVQRYSGATHETCRMQRCAAMGLGRSEASTSRQRLLWEAPEGNGYFATRRCLLADAWQSRVRRGGARRHREGRWRGQQ